MALFEPGIPLIHGKREQDLPYGIKIPSGADTVHCVGCAIRILLSAKGIQMVRDHLAQPACGACVNKYTRDMRSGFTIRDIRDSKL